MKRMMFCFVLLVLLVGIVSAADRTLYNLSEINIPLDVVAGNTFVADFSFRYLNDFVNPGNSPLIIQLNVSSGDESYPVWRNDFEISGRVEKYALWGLIHAGTVEFECNNSETQTIEHPLDSQEILGVGNGTFYCYDKGADMQLEEHDEVYLDIVSHYAIYPGEYNLTASMFYLTDGRAPFVNITNKEMFDVYYRELGNVEVRATIDDGSGIGDKWGTVFANYDITVPFSHETSGMHYFTKMLPIDIVEGDYDLFIFAEDDYNNTGNDSVTLRIDRTAPEIVLVQPNASSIYGVNDSLIIEVEVVDVKAGPDSSTVMYRISEIVSGSFCPDSGVIFGNYSCYNSGWISDWNSGDFVTEINISGSDFVSGSYWLEAGACDVLGNCGVL